jgi:recombination protein RecA
MRDELRALLAQAGAATGAARRMRLGRLDALDAFATSDAPGAPDGEPDRWGLDALRGRLIELSARGAAATLTMAIALVLEAQRAAEPVAWIMLGNGTFYPPDVADSGVDLAALVVVRVVDAVTAARAAERLVRSGAFGLAVLDFAGAGAVELSMAHQGRLVGLAQTHDAAIVCLTDKPADAPSLGSLISLRAEVLRVAAANRARPDDLAGHAGHAGHADHAVTVHALKDKRRGPGWSRTFTLRGPAGW